MSDKVKSLIRNIPDFPKQGIQFKDITPVLADATAFDETVSWFANKIESHGSCDVIAGIESRGFIFGAAIARQLKIALVPIRKPGKLPYTTHKIEYELEYGTDILEVHTDAINEGDKVAIVDDLLATGGTAAASCDLIKQCGGTINSVLFLIELDFLKGREKIHAHTSKNIESMIHY